MNNQFKASRWSIKTRIAGLISFALLGSAIFGWFTYSTLQSVRVNGPYYKNIVQGKDLIADILPPPEYLLESFLNAFQLSSEKDPAKQADLISKSKSLRTDYESRHDFWTSDLSDGPLKSVLLEKSYQPALEFLDIKDKEFIPAIKRGDWVMADKLMNGPLKQKYEEHLKAILEVVDLATERNKMDEAAANQKIHQGSLVLILLGAGILGSLMLIGLFISRFIISPLTRLIHALSAGSEQITSSSDEISRNSQHLATSATEQASSLEETSASLQQISSMTKNNSEFAMQANAKANETLLAVERSRTSMTRMTEAIGLIKNSSDQTSKIIKTIDEIAFQTNLLALNAAVEAARAGDAGKGFAVVAEEVRNLAKRSADAAQDTSLLIEESRRNAENGVSVSLEVGDILTRIFQSMEQLNRLIESVSKANMEEAKGIMQIGSAMTTMDKLTQSNANNAEESKFASKDLCLQAEELNEMIGSLTLMVNGSDAKPVNMSVSDEG